MTISLGVQSVFCLAISAPMVCSQGTSGLRQEIVKLVRKQRASMKSLEVVYRIPVPGQDSIGAFVVRRIAAKGTGALLVEMTHEDEIVLPKDWPARCIYYATSLGNTMEIVTAWPNRRIFGVQVLPKGRLPQLMRDDPFFLVSGWWPRGEKFESLHNAGHPLNVLSVLESPEYQITSDGIVGGRKVTLSKRGVDKLLLDERKGWALVTRKWKRGDPEITMSLTVNRLRHMSNGFWLPEACEVVRYSADGREVHRLTMELGEAKIDRVSAEAVTFKAWPGALRVDPVTKDLQQVVPGGLDMINEVARKLLQRGPIVPTGVFPWRHLLAFLGGVIIMLGWMNAQRKSAE